MLRRFLLVLFGLSFVAPAQKADPFATLRPNHPRLIALDGDIEHLRTLVREDAGARTLYARLAAEGAQLLTEPPLDYSQKKPPLITSGKQGAARIYTLALLYRLDGKPDYAKRAVRELRALANLPDWNPDHFLDTAQLAEAFAIGYDWLYGALSPQDREWIRETVITKALNESLRYYREHSGWAAVPHNWNLVCNGGIGMAALAIASEEPERARTMLGYVLESMPIALASYGPDGGWKEGPSYWQYATRYAVHFLAALQTSLGQDFGLSATPGFSRAGHFRIYSAGPADLAFNYGDGSSHIGATPELLWLAGKFGQPAYAGYERNLKSDKAGDAAALDLIWYSPKPTTPRQGGWPLCASFRGIEVATMRTAWDDPDAIFVAVKGGHTENGKGHTHLDLGSFVLDAGGTRWAMDFGAQKYSAKEYFGRLRWTYYRTRTEAHNTLLIDGENQNQDGEAAITQQDFNPDFAFARLDLSRAYPKKVTRLERGIAIYNRTHVIVQDELAASTPVSVLWGMITDGAVTAKGNTAELRKKNWTVSARILSPPDAAFDVVSTAVPAPQSSNEGTCKLAVRLPHKTTSLRLVIALTPHRDGAAVPQLNWKDRSLDQWRR